MTNQPSIPGVLVHVHDIFLPSDYPRDMVVKNLSAGLTFELLDGGSPVFLGQFYRIPRWNSGNW